MQLLIEQRPEISCAVQDTFNTHTLFIDREEDHVGAVCAGSQPLSQITSLGIRMRSEADLLRTLE